MKGLNETWKCAAKTQILIAPSVRAHGDRSKRGQSCTMRTCGTLDRGNPGRTIALRGFLRKKTRLDLKIAYEWGVVGQFYLGDLKSGDLYLRTVEDIVQLPAGRTAGVRGLPVAVGISQTCSGQK